MKRYFITRSSTEETEFHGGKRPNTFSPYHLSTFPPCYMFNVQCVDVQCSMCRCSMFNVKPQLLPFLQHKLISLVKIIMDFAFKDGFTDGIFNQSHFLALRYTECLHYNIT